MSSTASRSFTAVRSTQADAAAAVQELLDRVKATGIRDYEFGFLFASQHHAGAYTEILERLTQPPIAKSLIGCSGESIVSNELELEGTPALSLWLGCSPDCAIIPMHLEFEQTSEGASFVGWPDRMPELWPEGSAFFVLGDPFSFPVDQLLERVTEDQPGVPVLGGMASGGSRPGDMSLFLNGMVHQSGAVGLLLSGASNVTSVVSQGCRPIGGHFVVTKAEQNAIFELGGKPALEVFQQILDTLPEQDKVLIRDKGLNVGRVIDEYQDQFKRGDFLIRNVLGADTSSGAIAIGDVVRPGQSVQFHVRDHITADEDLREMLKAARENMDTPAAGLLFTCNGRGTNLFPGPNHDAGLVHEFFGEIPLSGFFAQGELGPVGGKNFIHGFTASLCLFSN